MTRIIVWLKNDLRLTDHEAINQALSAAEEVVLVYILDNSYQRPLGSAQKWWLHHSLEALAQSVEKRGGRLILRWGESEKELHSLLKEAKADAVYWNRSYEPKQLATEKKIKEALLAEGVSVEIFKGNVLIEPWKIFNKSGNPFKVYTPFKNTCLKILAERKLFSVPKKLKTVKKIKSDKLSDWKLLPTKPDWATQFKAHWKPGEKGAQKALKVFVEENLSIYQVGRDRPDKKGTSLLSPHLHFGEISVWQIYTLLKQVEAEKKGVLAACEKYIAEIIWREFCNHLLYYFPNLSNKNFQSKFDSFQWGNKSTAFKKWQKGLTGYPLVDAGMRELWATGYMHNRVRMVVASFLIKDLFIHWREGEKWFWETLLDADLASNSANWQWVAGSGADASPYFRVFNPTLQAKKFDPNGEYIKKWVPELNQLPLKYLFEPWLTPEEVLKKVNLQLGKGYPMPIVDHAKARLEALARYKALK